MLAALGTFLAAIVAPLNDMGAAIGMNAASFTGYADIADKPMSTVAFAAFAGPWIEDLGGLAIGLGTFLTEVVAFLQGIVSYL